jgi:hypothetical protein
MKIPFFRLIPKKRILGILPYYLTASAERQSMYLHNSYAYERFMVWRWMGAL